MLDKFLSNAIDRHLTELQPFIQMIDDRLLHSAPLDDGRALGEIIYHMLRSFEYYMRGITESVWETAPYNLDEFSTTDSLAAHWEEIITRTRTRLSLINISDFSRVIDTFNRPATVGEILLEMLEHSIHHRGQLTVYLRLLGITPPMINYII